MAEKLKGLLDRANSALGGLLGDAPKEFAVGAVSGVPGIVGDLGYTLANGLMNYTPGGRLFQDATALLGAPVSMPEMVDVPGTSDYLANQAGYAPPTTLSGQIGRILGGIAAPGPGEWGAVAKLVGDLPVLAAIPFWHGSPHKYDAVDLSKIGTGEGAQAYGWGYYGAESKGVAQEYQRALQGQGGIEGLDDLMIPPPDGSYAARISAMFGNDGTNHQRGERNISDIIEKFAANKKDIEVDISQLSDGSTSSRAAFTEYRMPDDSRIVINNEGGEWYATGPGKLETSYLYRGEYRWPDPAKEAATPLTGEDLLDWDKPLSEQSPQVRKAIHDYMTLRGVDSYKIDDGSSVYLDVGAENSLTGKDIYRDMWQASRNAAIDSGRNADTTFDAAQRAASDDLNFVGIPGIRYKDQMSRGNEGGTYNYVMFQDKGIKLLERNGEPIPAAAEFAARREGKPKPYREAMGIESPPPAPDYGINHRPPMRNSGAPLFDVTGGGNVYPDDVYSAKAQQYYGTGDPKLDRDTFRVLQAYRNEPDAPVTIYRAVPANVDANDINAGDWVTINKAYADMHGQGFDGGYKIIKKQVKAKDIYTNGDSIHEWGYDPN